MQKQKVSEIPSELFCWLLGRYFSAYLLTFDFDILIFTAGNAFCSAAAVNFEVFSLTRYNKYRLNVKIICSGGIYRSASACFCKKIPLVIQNIIPKR